MNSPNQPNRQYHHNTCELSIEDKKSPFPAWMKFNKPNPLKFSLSLQDPDRPEQPPINITGDRVKLDALHQTIEDYVSKVVAKAPLPLFENSKVEDSSGTLSNGLMATDGSVSMERPIDALKMTGDQPHIEADGPSRHLLYLGNMAADGQVMSSLSTLQLFDLSSTLEEATQPVTITTSTEDSSAALHSTVGQKIEPEVTATDSPAPPTAIPTTPLVAQKFETDVEEPRVILPSVAEAKESTIPDSLESQSSFFDRNSLANTTNRFRGPKPSLGGLNLPELPDFSNSPLTSIWLWLGLGTVATGILAFPFFSRLGSSDTTASKPAAVQSSPNATAETTMGTGIPSYQPSSPSTPNGLNSLANGSTPSSTGITSAGAGGSTAPISPQLSDGTGSGSGLNRLAVPGQSASGRSSNNPATNTTITGGQSPNTNLVTATGGIGNQQRTTTSGQQGTTSKTSTQSGSNSPKRDNTTPRGSIAQSSRGSGGVLTDPDGNDFFQRTEPDTTSASTTRSSSRSSQTKRPGRSRSTTSTTSSATSVTAQGQELADVPGNNSSLDTPITTPATDRSAPLSVPSSSQMGGDSPQVNSTRQYFQNRWKADPNPSYTESLQYVVRVGKNGRVTAIQGQTSASREYLNRTGFIKPGTQVAESSNSDKEQSIQVILRPDGSTEAISNP
jgi:Domain of unknown function (DUF4335)